MTLTPQDERLIKALALAIVDRPRATLKELAEAAGVSKATLHRFCGTRDNLVQMMESHGETVLNQITTTTDLLHGEPVQALRSLINEHLAHREMLVFLLFQYRPDTFAVNGEGDRWQTYADALDAFFLRGQQEGVFRIDFSAATLTELWLGTLIALIDGERRGRIPRAALAQLAEQALLHGVIRKH